MNLITEEINELRQKLDNFESGTLNGDDLKTQLLVYDATEKRVKLYLKAMMIAREFGLTANIDILQDIVGNSGKLKKPKKLEDRTAKRGR